MKRKDFTYKGYGCILDERVLYPEGCAPKLVYKITMYTEYDGEDVYIANLIDLKQPLKVWRLCIKDMVSKLENFDE